MRIITKNKENEILYKIVECQYIANKNVKDLLEHKKITENLADICYDIGGTYGLMTTLENIINKEIEQCNTGN